VIGVAQSAKVEARSNRETDKDIIGGENLNFGGPSARTRTFSIILMEVEYIEGKMKAVLFALIHFQTSIAHFVLLVATDNTTVLAHISKQVSLWDYVIADAPLRQAQETNTE